MAPTKLGKTDEPEANFELLVQMIENLSKQMADLNTRYEDRFRLLERRFADREATNQHDEASVNGEERNHDRQRHDRRNDRDAERHNFHRGYEQDPDERVMRLVKVDAPNFEGEPKEEVCTTKLLASDMNSEIESSEIVQPMMTLESCPWVESTYNKKVKGVTNQLEFLQFIDYTGFRGKEKDESICLHTDSHFPECYYNSNSPGSSSSQPGRIDEDIFDSNSPESSSFQTGRIDEDIFVKTIRVYKQKRWKKELLISFLIYLLVS